MITYDYTNVMYADFAIVVLCLFIGLWIKDRATKTTVFVSGFMYLFFTLLWHFPPGLIEY